MAHVESTAAASNVSEGASTSEPAAATAAAAEVAVDAPVDIAAAALASTDSCADKNAASSGDSTTASTTDSSASKNAASIGDSTTASATATATTAAVESARPKPPPARAAIVARAQGEVDQSGVLLPSQVRAPVIRGEAITA